jgi:hypothetical protein
MSGRFMRINNAGYDHEGTLEESSMDLQACSFAIRFSARGVC